MKTACSPPRSRFSKPLPDGKRVLVPVITYDMEANAGTTRLWLERWIGD